ncbi:CLUMA_CG015860, isoform A [Clunio marinus]|uniref:CLUMA_CG015860, isoform A n=1 Tax=Clunio marinus TaxID=568069 RepID=A0A1J1IUP7_9DIPT|nr:CLUMA_CG015860, isoform A [Clunio marinus]
MRHLRYQQVQKILSVRIGLDSSIIPLKHKNLYLIQSVDFFYPLCDDAILMGQIAFSNIVSDIYSTGVVNIDEVKLILSIPNELAEDERMEVLNEIVIGFKKSAKLVKCRLTIERINENPWCIIGGIATSVCVKDEIIFPTKAKPGDIIILTKPLGVQLATNASIWMEEDSNNWKKISEKLTREDIMEMQRKAVESMTTLNYLGAQLMHKYQAHAATDVTGFGITGHAENLLLFQEEPLDFILTKFPYIKNVKIIAEILNQQNKLNNGRMVETSGGLFICLPSEQAQSFCNEFKDTSGRDCWIIGHVEHGTSKVIIKDLKIVEA